MTPREYFLRDVARVLLAQVFAGAGVAVLAILLTLAQAGAEAALTTGVTRAKAAAFGALLGVLGSMLTARSVLQSANATSRAPGLAIVPLFTGVLLKVALVAGGVFAGMAWLQLPPLFLLLGYITIHAGYAWAGTARR